MLITMRSSVLHRPPEPPQPHWRSTSAGPSGDHLQYSPSGPSLKLAFGSDSRDSVGLLRSPQTLKPPCFEAAADERHWGCGGSGYSG